jgi:glycogen operon protein
MLIEFNPLQLLTTTKVGETAANALVAPAPRPAFTTARGYCSPFGPSVRNGGVNFALFSRHATQVDLVLFEAGKTEPIAEIPLDSTLNKTGDVWHILVRGLSARTEYGFRVHGPYAPQVGHRYNSRALLLDPYAPAVSGGFPWGTRDVGPMPRRGRLIFEEFDWGDDRQLNIPMAQTVLYEMHVRGFTRHPSSLSRCPGTFLGMCEKIPHLKSLGITAVQLMPILEFDEHDQATRNPVTGETLKNYWGYAQTSFFAPKAGYAAHAGQQVNEFKQMVKTFHAAGIEVILDVVYNHTCEGNEHGPTLSFRGLDNLIYYMLDRQGKYYNFSGCGNTFNCNHPVVRDLIIDSLTYLATELHVDGFRFDLASILGRGNHGKVLDDPPLLHHIAEDPRLASCKLIAEAWDAAGLSQLGKFPTWGRWAELNGQYRDDVRRFVRSEPNAAANLAKRICGSLDIYGDSSRHPYHSINFITCHDGFTLNDLVSYNHKHNWENGESNRDGWDDNLSYNCGHEGPTHDGYINHMRQKQMRNFLSILFLSQGVPLLLMGDEFARTQHGNNNAYCQDNETNWVNWDLADKNSALLRFTRMMIALRKRHFAVGREEFVKRVSWHGAKVGLPDWTGQSRTLAFLMYGGHGGRHVYVMFNTHWEGQRFALPTVDGQLRWRRLVDTNLAAPDDIVEENTAVWLNPSDHYFLAPRSTVILVSG